MSTLSKKIKRESWNISWPIILASFSNNIIGLTDTAFLSRISPYALGGGGLAVLFYYAITSVAMGWGTAIQIILARFIGKEGLTSVYHNFNLYLIPTLFISSFQFLLIYFSPLYLFYFFENSAVYQEFCQYITIRSFDVFPMSFYFILRGFFNAISNNKIVGYTAFLMIFVNFILNYIFAFGYNIIPSMGTRGIALASVITQSLVFIIYFFYYTKILKLKFNFIFSKNYFSNIFHAFKLSLPISFQNFISIGSFFIFMKIVEYMGVYALAISEITKNLYIFLMIPTWGFGSSASTIISRTIGEGNHRLVIPIIKIISFQNFLFSLIPILILLFYPSLYFFILTDDTQIINDSFLLARIVGIALLIYSFAWIWVSAVIGTGATYVAFLIEVFTLLIYLAYIILSYYYTQNIYLIWLCEIIYMLIMVIFSYIYIKSNHWRNIKIKGLYDKF